MQIKNTKLQDLYERYMNFINSNYIYAIINETTNTVSISPPGELARIFIKIDNEINSIVIKITQNPTIKMSNTNGKIYYLSTIDELYSLIAASKVIMDLKLPEEINTPTQVTKAMNGQGYLLNDKREPIGVVDLNLIPTNAFIYDTDKINSFEEKEMEIEKPKFRKSILKFFT